jgi:hypothetical protein
MILSKRYHEIMENIQLTTETREQILRHVSERERKAKVQTMKKWTKYLSVAACCALVVGAAYGIHTLHPDKTVSEEEDMTTTDVADGGVQMPNPMQEYGSAEELSDAVGFTVKEIGELPFTVKETQYFTYDDTLAEIRYTGDDQEVYFRKSQGDDEDNSDDAENDSLVVFPLRSTWERQKSPARETAMRMNWRSGSREDIRIRSVCKAESAWKSCRR